MGQGEGNLHDSWFYQVLQKIRPRVGVIITHSPPHHQPLLMFLMVIAVSSDHHFSCIQHSVLSGKWLGDLSLILVSICSSCHCCDHCCQWWLSFQQWPLSEVSITWTISFHLVVIIRFFTISTILAIVIFSKYFEVWIFGLRRNPSSCAVGKRASTSIPGETSTWKFTSDITHLISHRA